MHCSFFFTSLLTLNIQTSLQNSTQRRLNEQVSTITSHSAPTKLGFNTLPVY